MQRHDKVLFTQTQEGLLYEEARWPQHKRLALVSFGAAFCLLPTPFLWHDAAAFALLAVVSGALGLTFIAIGLVQPQQLRFDARKRRIVRRCGLRRETLTFDHVTAITVLRHAGLEDPDWFQVCLHLVGRRPIMLGIFNTHDAAAQWQQRLQALIG
ncbi:hypothetical protein ACG02S_10760 [Roseateles sp. DC23W]|uniref:Toxin CptA n=1 Tax=Pelomonas dachongensis TaxID=3299029 RepID=A0ABW7ELL3_9BURK